MIGFSRSGSHIGRLSLPSAIALVLSLSTGGLLCPPLYASDFELIGKQPAELTRSLFEKHPNIPLEDRDKIESILGNALNSPSNYLRYQDLSDVRRLRLNEELANRLAEYDFKQYNTPIMRETRLKALEITLSNFFNTPVYFYELSPELDRQLGDLADCVVAEAVGRYPDIAGSAVTKKLRDYILDDFAKQCRDDMIPTMKCPLPEKEYAAYRKEIAGRLKEAGAEGNRMLIPIDPRWESMTLDERRNCLEKSPEEVVNRLMPGFFMQLVEIKEKYRSVAVRDMFQEEVFLESTWREPIPNIDDLARKADVEREIQYVKSREEYREELAKRRLRSKMMSGVYGRPGNLDLGNLDDAASIAPLKPTASPSRPSPTMEANEDQARSLPAGNVGSRRQDGPPQYVFYFLAASVIVFLLLLTKRLLTAKTQN